MSLKGGQGKWVMNEYAFREKSNFEKKINQGTKRQKKKEKKKDKILNCLYILMLAAWVIKREKLELLTFEHKFDLIGTIEMWWQDSSD